MTTVKLTNRTASTLVLVVVTDKDPGGAQRMVNVAAGGIVTVDSEVAAISPDLYQKVADGKLVVTTGVMPTQVFPDGRASTL